MEFFSRPGPDIGQIGLEVTFLNYSVEPQTPNAQLWAVGTGDISLPWLQSLQGWLGFFPQENKQAGNNCESAAWFYLFPTAQTVGVP